MTEWPEARQLAAQYQSPGTTGIGFARYASTGTVTPELWENIATAESLAVSNRGKPEVEGWAEDMKKLRRLLAGDGVFPVEEVQLIPNEADTAVPAIGWIELGGLSVALTRSTHDGVLLVALEAQNGGDPVHVRIQGMVGPEENLWEGEIE